MAIVSQPRSSIGCFKSDLEMDTCRGHESPSGNSAASLYSDLKSLDFLLADERETPTGCWRHAASCIT